MFDYVKLHMMNYTEKRLHIIVHSMDMGVLKTEENTDYLA